MIVNAPECASLPPSWYTSFCADSSNLAHIKFKDNYLYLYSVKVGQLSSSWSLKSINNAFTPAGLINSNNGKFLYFFTHDTSNSLYLTAFDNLIPAKIGSEIQISLSFIPSDY